MTTSSVDLASVNLRGLADATVPDEVSAPKAPSGWRKLLRYFGTSLVAVALSQSALTIAYGFYNASVPVAVAIALAVSIAPSYWLNVKFVWPSDDRKGRGRQLVGFLTVAVLGSVLTAVIADATQALAKRVTTDHLTLTVVINCSAALTTLAVWLTRYVVLDRLIFRHRNPETVSPAAAGIPRARIPAPISHHPEEFVTSAIDRVPTATAVLLPQLDVSVVLPCYNEAESVGRCVIEAANAIAAAGLRGEVVVVDNNCTDGSAEIAREAGARVVFESVPGYGSAIRAGIRASTAHVVVMADADCTYPLDRLAELVVPVLAGDFDMMIGSRLDAATLKSMPLLHRYVGTPTLSLLVRKGVGATGLTDSQSGFRAFHRETMNSVGLKSTGMEFASEMLIRATQYDLRVREIPFGYRERIGESKLSTWSDGMRHLRLILRLSPHMLLWYPGLVLSAMAAIVYGLELTQPEGINFWGVEWQPIFLATILLMSGVGGLMIGAVLAFHLPTTSAPVRRRFRWLGSLRVTAWIRRVGLALGAVGIAINIVLANTSVAFDDPGVGVARRVAFAGLAQGLILTGLTIASLLTVYRVLLQAKYPAGTTASALTPRGIPYARSSMER